MKKTKTYACPGLLEWHVEFNVGGAVVGVDFTGGTIGTNGLIAGRFSTTNPALWKIIEGSGYYARGRIVCVRQA